MHSVELALWQIPKLNVPGVVNDSVGLASALCAIGCVMLKLRVAIKNVAGKRFTVTAFEIC